MPKWSGFHVAPHAWQAVVWVLGVSLRFLSLFDPLFVSFHSSLFFSLFLLFCLLFPFCLFFIFHLFLPFLFFPFVSLFWRKGQDRKAKEPWLEKLVSHGAFPFLSVLLLGTGNKKKRKSKDRAAKEPRLKKFVSHKKHVFYIPYPHWYPISGDITGLMRIYSYPPSTPPISHESLPPFILNTHERPLESKVRSVTYLGAIEWGCRIWTSDAHTHTHSLFTGVYMKLLASVVHENFPWHLFLPILDTLQRK